MRPLRPFAVRLSLALGAAAGVASVLGLGGVFSCSKYPTQEEVPTDCTVLDQYQFVDPDPNVPGLLDNFSSLKWWSSADYSPCTPNAPTNMTISGGCQPNSAYAAMTAAVPIPEGGVCGNTLAGEFQATHNNDWGCVYGMWGFDTNTTRGVDASMWQGLSFWARAPGNTTKSFTLILDDDNTYAVSKDLEGSSGTSCRSYPTDGGLPGAQTSGTQSGGTDPNSGTPITGSSNSRAAYPDECGNGFYYVVRELTSDWTFITIPWSAFKQSATPNRVPNGVLPAPDAGVVDNGSMLKTSGLRNLTLRMPKEAEMDLWMTQLGFYRKKAQ